MSVLQVDTIQDSAGTTNKELAQYSSGNWSWGSGLPSGSIVQVQHTQLTTNAGMENVQALTDYVVQDSSNSTSGGSVSGILGVNITPKIYGSKIWIQSSWCGEISGDNVYNCMFFYWRNSTKLANTHSSPGVRLIGIATPTISYHADDGGTTLEACFMQYFDTHGVSAGTAFTYKLGVCTNSASVSEIFTNRCHGSDQEVGVTSLCVIELAP